MSGAERGAARGGVLVRVLEARERRWWRVVFWVYAAVLFTLTHWPRLDVRVEGIDRPDLFVHFGAFGGWFGLFWLTGYAGRPGAWLGVLVSYVVALMYAGFDEGLQAIPAVHRTCAWDDFGFNCLGVTLGLVVAASAVAWCRRSVRGRA